MRELSSILLLSALLVAPSVRADQQPRARLDAGLTYARFEQQVKSEIGTEAGERLVTQTEFGLLSLLSYRFWGPLSAGGFMQLDAGERQAARFAGFATDGRTQVSDRIGGAFYELWMGPFVRAEWRQLFVEVGYGAYAARHDAARDDLATESGATDGLLRTHPTIAWLFALGGTVPVTAALAVALRIEYRIRYYTRRGGDALDDEIVHGTQNITPFLGIAWTLDGR
jgi:hypothetical protein